MTHNQQVPEISRTYLVIAPEKLALGEQTLRIIRISGTDRH